MGIHGQGYVGPEGEADIVLKGIHRGRALLPGCLAAWLPGCLAALLPRWKAKESTGR